MSDSVLHILLTFPDNFFHCVSMCTVHTIFKTIVFQIVGTKLPYDSLNDIRMRMAEVSPNLVRYGDVEEANYFAQATAVAQVREFDVEDSH